jgi:hypothetical protein
MIDEVVHFPTGISNLTHIDWRMDWESPTLVKYLPGGLIFGLTKLNIPKTPVDAPPNSWVFGYRSMPPAFHTLSASGPPWSKMDDVMSALS